ncbi:MAG TPA: hypothetical protein VF219_15765, partial [Vicinamibacterales bacterium]
APLSTPAGSADNTRRVPRSHAYKLAGALAIGSVVVGLSVWASSDSGAGAGIKPTYDKTTGKLTQLSYDSNHDGRPDTWTDMEGSRPLRSRIDSDGDGKIDRWEEYDETGALAKVAFSRRNDGRPDAWILRPSQDSPQRVDISSTGDENRIDRWEYYEATTPGANGTGTLVRVEEDTVGDGRPHKWEAYRGGVLESVAFDEDGDGKPDRRLVYHDGMLSVIESHPDGGGGFTVHQRVTR